MRGMSLANFETEKDEVVLGQDIFTLERLETRYDEVLYKALDVALIAINSTKRKKGSTHFSEGASRCLELRHAGRQVEDYLKVCYI